MSEDTSDTVAVGDRYETEFDGVAVETTPDADKYIGQIGSVGISETECRALIEKLDDWPQCGEQYELVDSDTPTTIYLGRNWDGSYTVNGGSHTLSRGEMRQACEWLLDEYVDDTSFPEYVRENVTLAEHEYVQPRGNNAMIVDGLNYSITISTFRDIQDDDGIRILSIQYSDVQDELIVRLKDTREGE
jgi:hypothetical protein